MRKNLLFLFMLFFSCFTMSLIAQEQGEQPVLSGKPIKVNKAEFIKLIYNFEKNPDAWSYEGTLPCIIDFYADWCGPCRKLAPTLEKIAKLYKGKVIVYKVDVEAQRELAAYFGIQTLPTVVFVPINGQPQAAMGLMPQETIEQIIQDVFQIAPKTQTEI
ncbi:MAG: thioredoxin domain-containing protein [Bacteroidales bacterium]